MTSIPPAEPGPPPLPRPPDLSKSFTAHPYADVGSTTQVKGENGVSSPVDLDILDDRPTKRRRVEPQTPGGLTSISTAQEGLVAGPKLKGRLVGDVGLLSELLQRSSEKPSDPSTDVDPWPLPVRPWTVFTAPKENPESPPSHRARANLSVPTSPDALELPGLAPQLVNKRPAGYFPWTGKHPEDVLSDTNVKQGYSDRPPNPLEKELNTARVPLYNAFKHRSGIDSLSTLFSLVLEAKNKHGLISSASSFKPPPRVTLTEAKRKSWISDLANAEVPLRRLSRTIPQGIRGQILLDQCLQNTVPLSRAIWFAKCVGANEIRTMKRKGTTPAAAMGTESKWLREWTVNVEQFVETVLSQCGQPSWKANIQYAIRLTTRLYLENLVDRDYYLAWLVKSFTTSSNDRLPFWLMMIHLYKPDIAKFRKTAKKIGEALLSKYATLITAKCKDTQSLVLKLQETIRGFAFLRPSFILMPEQWPEASDVVKSCLRADILQEQQLLEHLIRINERSMGSNRYEYLAKPLPRETVLELLDSANAPYNAVSLDKKLKEVCPDIPLLAVSCMEWASSRFRSGKSRIYLVSRLLRRWQRQGQEVDSIILAFVASCHQRFDHSDTDALKHLIAELSRSQTFSISKYMQWLTVRGLPRPASITAAPIHSDNNGHFRQHSSEKVQLLMDLALANVDDHVLNLRDALLSRADFKPELERELVNHLISGSIQDIEALGRGSSATRPWPQVKIMHSNLPWTIRSRVSYWIRGYVSTAVKDHASGGHDKHFLQRKDPITQDQFHYIRNILETLEDVSVLADVLGLLSTCLDESLQASFAETVLRHAVELSAIGALDPLQSRVCRAYLFLRSTKSTLPLLATALLDLCARHPSNVLSVKLLQQDLVRGDRGRAIAACSPFSDGIAESLQQAEATFIEDYEAVLQSEPSMNEQTMSRLFAVLTERIEKQLSVNNDEQSLFVYCQLLARLRLCRRIQGDILLKGWLLRILSKSPSASGQQLVACLIRSGCLSFDRLMDGVKEMKELSPGRKVVVEILRPWLFSETDGVDYPVDTKWAYFVQRRGADVLNLAAETGAATELKTNREMVTRLIVDSPNIMDSLSDSAQTYLSTALNRILNPEGDSPDIKALIQAMDTLSIPFVQVRLKSLAQSSKIDGDDNGILANILSEVLTNDATGPGHHGLYTLLRSAGPDVAARVRDSAEEHVLEMLPKFGQGRPPSFAAVTEEELARLSTATEHVFEVSTRTAPPSARLLSQLCERLAQYLKFLGNLSATGASLAHIATSPTSVSTPVMPNIASQISTPLDNTPTAPRQYPAAILDYLNVVLRLLCLQRSIPPILNVPPTTPNAPPSKQRHTDMVKILTLLASIITHACFTNPTSHFPKQDATRAYSTADFALDVMATLLDDLPDEGRVLCGRILRDKLRDDSSSSQQLKDTQAQLRWLFGSVNSNGSDIRGGEEMGSGLVMVKEGRGVLGEWKPKVWEVLESAGAREGEMCLGLGLFGARKIKEV